MIKFIFTILGVLMLASLLLGFIGRYAYDLALIGWSLAGKLFF